jgi:hypothetical protein
LETAMMRNSIFPAALCMVLLTGGRAGFAAGSDAEMAFDHLAPGANVIVVARVEGRHSYWSSGLIYTDHTLRVHKVVRGRADSTIVVTEVGGEVGAVGLRVSESAVLAKGVEYLLLLQRRDPSYAVFGGNAGQLPWTNSPTLRGLVERLRRPQATTRQIGKSR